MVQGEYLVTKRPLSVDKAFKSVIRADCGGVCVFVGTVRNRNEGKKVKKLSYSAYPGMAVKGFKQMSTAARKKYGVLSVYIAHRTGTLAHLEASVIIATAAPHRAEAFQGCRYIIEQLKKNSPIWKEEFYTRGGKTWVGAGL